MTLVAPILLGVLCIFATFGVFCAVGLVYLSVASRRVRATLERGRYPSILS
jgi:hypothetical protein